MTQRGEVGGLKVYCLHRVSNTLSCTGWALSSGTCEQCRTNTVSYSTALILVGVFGILLLLILLFVFSCWPLVFGARGAQRPEELEPENFVEAVDNVGEASDRFDSVYNKAEWLYGVMLSTLSDGVQLFILGYVKVLIAHFQILSSFGVNLSVQWPDAVEKLFSGSMLLRFDVIRFPGLSCLSAGLSYTTKLLIYTIFPAIIVCLLLVAPLVSRAVHGVGSSKLDEVMNLFFNSLFFFLFFYYPTVSMACLASFR